MKFYRSRNQCQLPNAKIIWLDSIQLTLNQSSIETKYTYGQFKKTQESKALNSLHWSVHPGNMFSKSLTEILIFLPCRGNNICVAMNPVHAPVFAKDCEPDIFRQLDSTQPPRNDRLRRIKLAEVNCRRTRCVPYSKLRVALRQYKSQIAILSF